jgi:hypothetical protein
MINKLHPQYDNLSIEQVEAITSLHHGRQIVVETAALNADIAKTLYPLWYQFEKTLQELWKFPNEDAFIRFWRYPYCTCPKLDNDDAYPTGFYTTNGDCPIHG